MTIFLYSKLLSKLHTVRYFFTLEAKVPTKHIDDASYALAEENLVKAVMLTQTAIKESEILALLIRKGAQTITPLDILSQLPVATSAWNNIFMKVMDECAAHYPKDFIRTPQEFCKHANKFSTTWQEYRNDEVHKKIRTAGERLRVISEMILSHLESTYYLETEEEKQRHEEWLIKKHKEMHEGLPAINGNMLGALSESEKDLLEMMLESDNFQVSFTPVPERRREEGQQEFTVRVSPFPNATQAALLGLLDELKAVGLKLKWRRTELNHWLQDRTDDELDDLVFSLFTPLDDSMFSFTGDYEKALTTVKACLKEKGAGLMSNSPVTHLLTRLAGCSDK